MEMVEVKTSELRGPALDWCAGIACQVNVGVFQGVVYRKDIPGDTYGPGPVWSPSTEWIHGGPMIEKFLIKFTPVRDGRIFAEIFDSEVGCAKPCAGEFGARQLIAACRAIVAAKLGDTVSVPKELMQ